MDIRYAVVFDSKRGNGQVLKVDRDNRWTANNPNGWIEEEVAHSFSPNATFQGTYESREEAENRLDNITLWELRISPVH
jgi:hypothetical protein